MISLPSHSSEELTCRSKLDLRATVVLIISCNLGIYFIAYNFRQFVFVKMRDCFLPSASIVVHPPMLSKLVLLKLVNGDDGYRWRSLGGFSFHGFREHV